MPESKGKHLTLEDREVIEDGIRDALGVGVRSGAQGMRRRARRDD